MPPPDEVLIARQAALQAEAADVLGFDYRDERGERSPTGTTRD